MASWIPTNADRNGAGHIRAPGFDQEEGTAFAAALSDSLAAVGATPAPAVETPPAPVASRPRRQLALAAAGVVLVALLVALLATAAPVQPVRPAATPLPVPTALPATPTPAGLPRLPRALVAFSAPAGEPIGAIEAGRAYTATAVYGASWVQLDIAGSGRLWVRAADVPEAQTAGLPDLAPPPTPAPVPPPAVPAPIVAPEQPTAAPATATPLPTANGTATVQAIQARLDATSTSVYATAAALGVPGGVTPWTRTPKRGTP